MDEAATRRNLTLRFLLDNSFIAGPLSNHFLTTDVVDPNIDHAVILREVNIESQAFLVKTKMLVTMDLMNRWNREGFVGTYDSDMIAFAGPRRTYIVGEDFTTDFHAWLVDGQGRRHDYSVNVLKTISSHPSDEIVYKKWNEEWASDILPRLKEEFMDHVRRNMKVNRLAGFEGFDRICRMFHDQIMDGSFGSGACSYRCFVLLYISHMKRNDDNLKMVIGSLGFKQRDGRIFWEYG